MSSLSSYDKIVSIQLVLKQETDLISLRLYEIIGDEPRKLIDLLDTGEYSGRWQTLEVHSVKDSIDRNSGNRNYHLTLSMTTEDGELLGVEDVLTTIKPMLLVYTNDLNWLGSKVDVMPMMKKSNQNPSMEEESQQIIENKKRSVNNELDSGESSPSSSLEQMKLLSCRRQVAPPTFDLTLIWPGEDRILLRPTKVELSFCYGSCNTPSDDTLFDLRARMQFLTGGIIAPCCVPGNTTSISLTFQNLITTVVSLTSFPNVVYCLCR